MCDYLDSILITHALGGGTGSGVTDLLMERLSVDCPKKNKVNLLVYPSPKYSDTVVEPYNTVLAGHSLL